MTNGTQETTFRHFFNQRRFGPFQTLSFHAYRRYGHLLGSSVDVRKSKDMARVARHLELALCTRTDLHLALVNKGDFLVDVASAMLCSHLVQCVSRHFIEMIRQIQTALARQKNGRNITKMGATVITRVLQARDEDEGRGRRDSLIRFPDSSATEQRRLQKYLLA